MTKKNVCTASVAAIVCLVKIPNPVASNLTAPLYALAMAAPAFKKKLNTLFILAARSFANVAFLIASALAVSVTIRP